MATDEEAMEDFLAHFGVLGMKWGKHLPGREATSIRQPRRKELHPDHIEKQNLKRNGAKRLSTAEIKKVNDRIQAEQNYKKLSPGTVGKGKKIMLGLIAAAGTGVTVYNMVQSPAGKKAIEVGSAALDRMDDAIWKAVVNNMYQ
jgi:hypothetical protein